MTGEIAVRADRLGKQYRIGRSTGSDTLREAIAGAARHATTALRGKRDDRAQRPEWFWALRDVTFEIAAGHAVGIVGANGAGKSTLLKLLSRITEPTVGRATIRGRVGSLLEVGTGFHPELTGRENIYLNGAILGMPRREIERRFDEIVSFAEVERFLEMPVKHYSDGMNVRLAFAVAAHVDPDVLLIDEVLAVGDARFQKKCLGKMADITEEKGRTVLFVSHNLDLVQRLCAQSLLLDAGQIVDFGPTAAIIGAYLRDQTAIAPPDRWIDVSAMTRRGTGEARFRLARYRSGNADLLLQPYPEGPLEFEFVIDSDAPRTVPSFGVVVADRNGVKLVNADVLTIGKELRLVRGSNQVRLRIDALHLNPGVYHVALWLGDTIGVGYDLVDPAFDIELVATGSAGFGVTPGSEYGSVTCSLSIPS